MKFLVGEDKGVDIVLATNEAWQLIEDNREEFDGVQFNPELDRQSFDFQLVLEDFKNDLKVDFSELGKRPASEFKFKCNSSTGRSTSNNYLNQILIKLALDDNCITPPLESSLKEKERRNKNFTVKIFVNKFRKEVTLTYTKPSATQPESGGMDEEGVEEVKLKGARVYGFKNIQNLMRQIKSKRCKYQYVEIMACPSGCNNGGGQLKYENEKPKIVCQNLNEMMHSGEKIREFFFENEFLLKMVDDVWEGREEIFGAKDLEYDVKELEEVTNPVAIKW